MLLPQWVLGHRKQEFKGYPQAVTVYFSMGSLYSEIPYMPVTTLTAMYFESVEIIFPSTLEYYTQRVLPQNQTKAKDTLLQELEEKEKKSYLGVKDFFMPLIERYGKQVWHNECKKDWSSYTQSLEYKKAKKVLNQVYDLLAEQELHLSNSEDELENGEKATSNLKKRTKKAVIKNQKFSDSLKTAIDNTIQKRLNNLHDTKRKIYDCSSDEFKNAKKYLLAELAQLLVLAKQVKEQFLMNPHDQNEAEIPGHAILYANKLNEAMYKLLEILKIPIEHRLYSDVQKILIEYKIPSNLLQPLSINWHDLEVREIINKVNRSKEEVINMMKNLNKPTNNMDDMDPTAIFLNAVALNLVKIGDIKGIVTLTAMLSQMPKQPKNTSTQPIPIYNSKHSIWKSNPSSPKKHSLIRTKSLEEISQVPDEQISNTENDIANRHTV